MEKDKKTTRFKMFSSIRIHAKSHNILRKLPGVIKLSLDDLWSTNDDGVEHFQMAMCIRRYKVIMRCLRFDDKSTREDRKMTARPCPYR